MFILTHILCSTIECHCINMVLYKLINIYLLQLYQTTSISSRCVVLICIYRICLRCRNKNISLHVANSGAILNGIGTDLDFVRPGIAMYGLPPGKYLYQVFIDFFNM